MILTALVETLKRRSKGDFKGRHFDATLILQAVVAVHVLNRMLELGRPNYVRIA